MKVIDPIKRLQDLRVSSERRIIGIAGLPGAGKSTLSKALAESLGKHVLVLGMDGFHYTKAKLQTFQDPDLAMARRGAPWTFDALSFVRKLKELRKESCLTWPDFQHGIGDPVEDAIEVVEDHQIVIVEGLYILYRQDDWSELEGCFDETWYLNVSEEVAQERIIKRHMKTRNLSYEQARSKAENNDLLNGKLVIESSQYADAWIKLEKF